MENTVTAAPLLVRKGIAYTKLAVTQTGSGEERRGAVLHLGTGEGERENWLSKTEQKRWERCEREELFSMGVCLCVADRGELHRVAVVGQNATLLQEIPLFTSQEPVNNILLHQVAHLQINSRSETHRHKYTKCPEYLLYYSVFL